MTFTTRASVPTVVEILERRLVDLGALLAGDADQRALAAEQILDQAHAARPPDVDRDHRHGKEDAVTKRQDGNGIRHRTRRRGGACGHDRHRSMVRRPES